jgi:hypothetical protein
VDGHQKLWTTSANPCHLSVLSYLWCNMIGVSDEAVYPRGGKQNDKSDIDPVGRVLGTADATPLSFWTAVTPGSYLQLDDVVVTRRDLPDREPVTIAGVVTQVRARHEGAQFDSDVFAIAEGTLPALVQEAAEITTTRVDPELYVPPAPGAVVHRASGEARDAALHFDRMERRIPRGSDDGSPAVIRPAPAPASCGETVRHSSSTRPRDSRLVNTAGPPSQTSRVSPRSARSVSPASS